MNNQKTFMLAVSVAVLMIALVFVATDVQAVVPTVTKTVTKTIEHLGKTPFADSVAFGTINDSTRTVTGYDEGIEVYVVTMTPSTTSVRVPTRTANPFQAQKLVNEQSSSNGIISAFKATRTDLMLEASFVLNESAPTNIRVYDEAGNVLATKDAGMLNAGQNVVQLPLTSVKAQNGLFVVIGAAGTQVVQKVQLMQR